MFVVQLQRPPTIHVQPPQVATQAPPLLSATQGLPLLSANQIKPMSPVKLSLPGSSFLTANQVAPMPVQQTIQGNSIQTSNHVSSVVPDKQVPPQNVHVSGIGCLGPACSAPGARCKYTYESRHKKACLRAVQPMKIVRGLNFRF